MKASGWLNASKKNGACPLCDHFDWCSFSEDKKAVLCRRTDIVPPGWERTKAAKDGIGFVFVVKKNSTQQDLEQWKRERLIQRQQRERSEKERRAFSLSLVERDRQFRKLLDQLSLSPLDKTDLQRRGLTDEEIKLGGFKSVEVWQKLDFEVDYKLPGVNLDGRSLNIKPGDEGYLCPIKNAEGLITGCQLRRRTKDDSGRYRWLTSATKKRPNGTTSHLPNDELPISVHLPATWNTERLGEVGLAEGVGVKPFVAAQRLGIPVIGAASANFVGSPEQFKEALEKVITLWQLHSNSQTNLKLLLLPDAGAINNSHNLKQYDHTYQLLNQWKHRLNVGWWGQFLKSDSDIDELPNSGEIEELTFAQFQGLAKSVSGNDFCVSIEKQAYYCFHCQRSGNAINFLMGIGKQSFTDTILKLAKKHQVSVVWDTKNPQYLAQETIELVKNKTNIFETISEHLNLQKRGKDFQGSCPFHNSKATPFNSISTLFKSLKSKLDGSFRGFGEQRVKPIQKAKPESVKINIPTPEDYHKLGHPHIIYNGEILPTWQQVKELGYKAVLDKSATGVGKSHAAGEALPADFDTDKIFYLATDHTNPTTLSVEKNNRNLPPRSNGFKEDELRLTPLGLPFKVHPKHGEQPDTPGNCFRTSLFHHLAGKNLRGIEQSNKSPICATCHLAGACKSSQGEGYGFRFERREAFLSDRLRAHPDSMPSIYDGEYSKWMGIWDEAGRLIKSTKLIDVKLSDFDKLWAELEAKLPEHHQTLTELRRNLRPFLTGELKQPYHGWSHAEIKAALPEAPDNILRIADKIENALHPDLLSLLKEPDNVDFRGNTGKGVSQATRQLVRETLRKQAYTESTKNLDSVLLNWLPQFLRIWGGQKGAFRCQWGTLTIASRDERHADIVKAFSFNVFLDATVDPDVLALRLGIPRHELLVIEKAKPTYQNLRIVQVSGFGKLGKSRSDSIEQRVQLFQAWLRQKHSDIDFIDWLTFADFAHFREGRGSNQFINNSALASFGVPYQNIGALQLEYQTLTGKSPDDPEFQAFVDAHVQEEITQEVGRLRSHLAPEQQKTFYFVADYDISFLASSLPGVQIESQDIINMTPEAAGGVDKTKWVILQGLKQVVESKAKITIDAVAAAAGVSQPCVSKIAKPFGGWKKLEKILRVLLSKLYSVGNIFSTHELELMDKPESELSDSEYAKLKDLEAIKFMATEYLPLAFDEPEVDVPTEVQIVFESFGWKGFEQIVGLLPIQSKAKLLGTLFNMLPRGMVDELSRAHAFTT